MEAQRASQEQTKQQASVTVAQASATEKVNVTKFVAGNLATHMQSWRSITSDPSILEMVAGYSLEFDDMPFQPAVPHSSFSKGEELIIAAEIKKLLEKGVINEATHGANEYVSTVFTRPKKDGSHRLILNLKNLNQFITYQHIKMESLQSAVQLIQKTIGWQYSISRMLTILCPLTLSTESTSDLSLKILSMSLHVYHMVSPRPQGCLQKL